MNYTDSPDHVVDPNTGNPRHEQSQAAPTYWSEKDASGIIWEAMEIIKEGIAAGAYPAALAFDETNPASYSQMRQSIVSQIANAIATYATTAGNTYLPKLNGQADNLTLAANATSALGAVPLQQVQAIISAATAQHTQYVKKAGDTMTGDLVYGGASRPRYGFNNTNITYLGIGADFDASLLSQTYYANNVTIGGIFFDGAYVIHSEIDVGAAVQIILHTGSPTKPVYVRRCISGVWTGLEPINIGIGIGQTRQDVLASRALGVVYTNATNAPIMVMATVTTQVGMTFTCQGISTYNDFSTSEVVPAGATYSITSSSPLSGWVELR